MKKCTPTPRPLLTEAVSCALGQQRFNTQEILIREYLATFPHSLAVCESFELFTNYIDMLSKTNPAWLGIARYLERFILWVMCVEMKPLDELTNQDLRKFMDFCSMPAENWVGTPRARFVDDKEDQHFNPQWRPFARPIKNRDAHYKLNRFFKAISPALGHQLRISPSEFYGEMPDLLNEQDLLRAETYIEYLDKLPRSTIVAERSLFVFSTCYYLGITFEELCVERSYFCMACFELTNGDSAMFVMRGNYKNYRVEIPAPLVSYLKRYREFLNLPPIPSKTEIQPALSDSILKKCMWRLPPMSDLPTSPSNVLRRAVGFKAKDLKNEILHGNRRAEASRQYRRSWERKCSVNPAVALNLAEASQAPTVDRNSHLPVLPLFDMNNHRVLFLSAKESYSYVECNFPPQLVRLGLEAAELLHIYASISSARLKILALEKLLLWAIFFAGKSIFSLTSEDAQEFYKFCLRPPLAWCSKRGQPRFLSESDKVLPNPKWAPFAHVQENQSTLTLRAARIIVWCNTIYKSLLERDFVKVNIFSKI
ncbi:hypothetical protein [Pseudomonas sp. Irchel 3A7]|uniref:hypothetical protein n=1 Tax=Pseudomonas sp. Irchel 3A7 TaxID=2008913 RepID=UPI00113FD670|nr:hypothetical protein [Pseudomonas sp. Irchel 3A7]